MSASLVGSEMCIRDRPCRAIWGVTYTASGPSATDQEIAAAYAVPRFDFVMIAARLRYFKRLCCNAPPVLLCLLECHGKWLEL
eukprot:10665155-Alexandrium_andersonii.AAC.1